MATNLSSLLAFIKQNNLQNGETEPKDVKFNAVNTTNSDSKKPGSKGTSNYL